MLKRNEYFLVSILTPIVFTMLFVARAMDDNRLTSWQWVFNGVNASAIFLVLLAGSILMVLLSRISCSVRRPGTFLFLSSFVAAVPFWTEPEIIVDASRYFTQAKYLEVYGIGHFVREWGRDIAAWTDLPLVPFLYGLIFSVLGESRLYIQVFTTCLFSATVVITYLIGKDLWNRDIGFYGGILLLGFPY
ncbi:MAG TPA: hypothetical protein VN328_02990, partial [Thermodesulfovibrionales bacterium]|nr:hypothetical protein [Thermodesulfovibrionales bacterium]